MMETTGQRAYAVFAQSVQQYHLTDCVDTPLQNPYAPGSPEALFYQKNWIDAVQWHLEDIIRDPQIDPVQALVIKRRIDKSNQDRTDLVEQIDEYFFHLFEGKAPEDAPLNTETPAWAFDRLSILALKLWHMQEQVDRPEAEPEHRAACARKLAVLRQQREDLLAAIETLLADLEAGRKRMRLYKQMKMYNDPALNPVLYARK